MPPNQFKTKDFKSLQREWYKKLKDTGFDDAEQDEEHLKLWSRHFFSSRYKPHKFSAKEEYYRIAGHFLHDYKFTSERERLIWELHCQGKSIRTIIDVLKSKNLPAYRNVIHPVIKDLVKKMLQYNKLKVD